MIIGFTNGCFDLFHEGHIHFLTACRRQCDYLIVAVNSDEYCRRVKGDGRPYNKLGLRMLHVRSMAESVIPFSGNPGSLIKEILPQVYFQSSEYQQNHVALFPDFQTKTIYIDRLPQFSTTLEARRRRLPS